MIDEYDDDEFFFTECWSYTECWSDPAGDRPPMPREYVKCQKCGGDYNFAHHCDLLSRIALLEETLRKVKSEVDWARNPQHEHRLTWDIIDMLIKAAL